MASMSYCVFENTVSELHEVIRKLHAGEASDWSDSEIRAVEKIFNQCDSIREYRDEIMQEIEELTEEEN